MAFKSFLTFFFTALLQLIARIFFIARRMRSPFPFTAGGPSDYDSRFRSCFQFGPRISLWSADPPRISALPHSGGSAPIHQVAHPTGQVYIHARPR